MKNSPKILIVDDSKSSRVLLEAILSKAGYKGILMAKCANEAFDILGMNAKKRKPGSDGFDLILMDLEMPEINGIEACRQIKKIWSLMDIPIIMVTASRDVADLQKAFDWGAIDYIEKPVHKIELLARIRSVLKLKEEMDRRKELMKKLETANLELKKLSSIDGLTGIANRRIFDEFTRKEWRLALRHQKTLSLVMLDVDFFKKYNDTYGHQEGDECLKSVAKSLQKVFKRPGDLVARYGGEEFVAILSETNSLNAKKLAEKSRFVIEALKIDHEKSEASKYLTISIGTATTTPHRDSLIENLMHAADKALYRAKHEGRNKVCSVDLV